MKNWIKGNLESFKWIALNTKGYFKAIFVITGLGVLTSLAGVASAIISKNIIDNAVNGNIQNLIFFGIAFCCIILFYMGSNGALTIITVRTEENFCNNLRLSLYKKFSMSQWTDTSKYHSGDILTRLTSDIDAISNGVINVLPSIISLGVQLIAAFSTLLYYEPSLAYFAIIFVPFTIVMSRIWASKLKNLHKKIQESEGSYRSFIQESVENMTIVKAFQLEEKNVGVITNLHNNLLFWVTKRAKTGVIANLVLASGYWISYIITFGWGTWRLASKAISFGTLTAFLQLVGQVQGPFLGLSRTFPQIISTLASAERLMELEKLELEKRNQILDYTDDAGVKLQDVYFSYNKDDCVLNNVSIDIKPGEIVALTGPSGEGKTTIIRLLLALLKPDKGSVYFTLSNGEELEASASTRELIAYVPQGNTLFSGTIGDNIRNGNPQASDDEIISAAKTACAWEFIEKLPDGLNTVIGENGLGLSEGQAQRVALARAIVRKAPILILDEATSALDMDLELRVLEGIKSIVPARSCFVITHRHSALKICSKVYNLKDGFIDKAN